MLVIVIFRVKYIVIVVTPTLSIRGEYPLPYVPQSGTRIFDLGDTDFSFGGQGFFGKLGGRDRVLGGPGGAVSRAGSVLPACCVLSAC